jgi:ribonuclease D
MIPHLISRLISKEEIAALPIRRYEGDVNLVTTPADLERAMEDIRAESVTGFDTETRPAFRKGESYLPCLIQVATARRVHLFPLQRLDCSAASADLLGSPAIVKTGVGLKYDLERLKLVFPFVEAAVVDLGTVAKRRGLEQSGVRNLAGMFLGFRIPKSTGTSNWAAPRLTEQQIVYAATDAWACRELYLRFAELGMLAQLPDGQRR